MSPPVYISKLVSSYELTVETQEILIEFGWFDDEAG